MGIVYRVAVHYGEDNGYVEYTEETKSAQVVLKTPEKKAVVEAYLAAEHEINIPHETLLDFTKHMIQPLASLENFKLSLTRLWGETDVYVDWSRPVE